jgi:predicted nucleotidyltransferase
MVAAQTELERIVDAVVSGLEPDIPVNAVVLFGSYASGTPRDWSDIDVAIVSPAFSSVPLWRRQEILAETLADADVRLSPIGYSPEEYCEPATHSFLREIIRTGRVVYQQSND